MRAEVDRDGCTGCGVCESICPEVFRLDEENLSTVIVDEIPAELEDSAVEAQEECPVSVINIE